MITPEVEAIRNQFGFPGMSILQFAFGNDPQGPDFRPHNYPRARVAYTGTHDYDTTVGWWTSAGAGDSTRTEEDVRKEHDYTRRYLNTDWQEIHWAFIRALMASVADTVDLPLAGRAGLGERSPHESARDAQRQLALALPKRRPDARARPTVSRNSPRSTSDDHRHYFYARPRQFLANLEHEFRLLRHPVRLGSADGEHERHLRIPGRASADQIPMLWLAAPLTGLIVQPIIGHMSDHTWGRLGRRRPYFLTGAILSSLALIADAATPPRLWMAAGLLWILDASINISMEPFRAFVADLLPEEQRTRGFAMQSLFIGLGAVIASALPWMLTNWLHVGSRAAAHAIPLTVRFSFYIGAVVFFGAVLWTILTTKEYPPEDLEAFRKAKSQSRGRGGRMRAKSLQSIGAMPETMRQLALVQICTWLGLFCMWLYFPVAVAHNVFGATDTRHRRVYTEGVEWGGFCFAMYSAVCFAFSFALPALAARLGPQDHALASACCAAPRACFPSR